MPRKRTAAQAPPAPAADSTPAVIHANAVFTRPQLQQLLGLTREGIRREVKLGRLRVCKRSNRYFFLGEQVLDWLRGGELPRRQPADQAGAITPERG